jgi:hypothetical protein
MMFTYLLMLLPLFALLTAVVLCSVWKWKYFRSLLAFTFSLAVIEGFVSYQTMHHTAEQTTPYAVWEAQIAEYLPPNSCVMGMQHYWLGLIEWDYRTLLVPIFLTNPIYVDEPQSFASAVDAFAPDYLLIDEVILHFLRQARDPQHPYYELANEIDWYLQRGQIIANLYDHTYGQMLIYQFNRED